MALGRDRTPQSLQGFDPDFFGGGCSDGHLGSFFLDDVDHWAFYPSTSSVLSFEQEDGAPSTAKYPNLRQEEEYCASWINAVGSSHDPHGYRRMDSRRGRDHFRLLYPSVSGSGTEGGKRPYMGGDDMQAAKKLCGNNKKARAMPSSASSSSSAKDPQSIAAKNRRERISERLKVLQELVPNGTKVRKAWYLHPGTMQVQAIETNNLSIIS